jgi:hypothetical protein
MFKEIDPKKIVIDKRFQGICRRPFYGHPHGCPNYGKKQGCPPINFLENEIFDFNREMFVIYTCFNIGEFAEKMRQTHPEWEKFPRQLYNPRRWQPTARKMHRLDIVSFLDQTNYLNVDSFPEAKGVNITELMKQIGINLNWEWPPQHILENNHYKNNVSYLVSLAGHLVNSHRG